ncbi:MAG: hypothetical protein JNM88_19135 [Chitinophagaceae bacterium]|nr:hypothetical protein [Chitinophagaceae bacterium]
MATFTAKISIDAGFIKLNFNGDRFLLANAGQSRSRSEQNLKKGKHVVQWFVEGQPGTFYTLDITSPTSAITSIKKMIKPIGKDYGSFSFDI